MRSASRRWSAAWRSCRTATWPWRCGAARIRSYVLRGDRKKAETLFQSRFGFQNVAWSDALKGLVAAEEGGKLWLLDADGKPKAELDETAGTTAYRMLLQGGDVLLGRMSRVVQRVKVQ